MKFTTFKYVTLGLVAMLFSSCAATYQSFTPKKISYPEVQTIDPSLVVQYKYDVLTQSNNKKYAKKETKFRTNLVALKITNNTDSIINTSQLQFTSGGKFINPLTTKLTKKRLKQKGAYHLFYLLLSPLQLYAGTSVIPIGLGLGPGLALLNIGIAAGSNKSFENNLKQFELEGKTISPKESIYVLVGFSNSKGDPIYAKIKR